MRSNAGTTQEPVIIVALLAISAAVGYAVRKPWGAIAGPVLLILAITLLMLLGFSFRLWSGRASRLRLFDAANRRTSLPRPEWIRLVSSARVSTEHQAAVLAVAGDGKHPLCEAFLELSLRFPGTETTRLVAAYVADHPDAGWTLVEHAVKSAPPETLESVAQAALASPDRNISGMAACQLMRRTDRSDPAVQDVIRRLADRIKPNLPEWEREALP